MSLKVIDAMGAKASGERLARMQRSPNYKDGTFQNPVPTVVSVPGTMSRTLFRMATGKEERFPKGKIPVVALTRESFASEPASGLRVTWLGHSSVLVEIDGRRILIDPVFSERVSPSQNFGPKRFHPAPLANDAFPPLDAIILTHDHYDHLDMDVVRALANDPVQSRAQFVTALGVGAHLEHWGIASERITELDISEAAQVGGLTITATPARHFSGRGLKRNETLWASWVIVGPHHRVFHTGDTGYYDGLAEIGNEFGPFDLTMVKIGAYGETWPDIHLTPEDAVRVHQMMGGPLMLPIHWGTFNLAFHAWNEPAERLIVAASAVDLPLVMPIPGQMFEPVAPPSVEHWWRI